MATYLELLPEQTPLLRLLFFHKELETIHFPSLRRRRGRPIPCSEPNLSTPRLCHSPSAVCNPLRQTSLVLPPMSTIRRVIATGIIGGEGDNLDTYKVVALGEPRQGPGNRHVVEIYDSLKMEWKVAGHLLNFWPTRRMEELVFSGDFCYRLVQNNAGTRWSILGFSDQISEPSPIITPLPVLTDGSMTPKLFTCGSRLLLVKCIEEGSSISMLIIWEFQMDAVGSNSPSWKEMARMPPSMIKELEQLPFDICFDWVGLEDCLFFKAYGYSTANDTVLRVGIYNINENSWSWLPTSSMPLGPAILVSRLSGPGFTAFIAYPQLSGPGFTYLKDAVV